MEKIFLMENFVFGIENYAHIKYFDKTGNNSRDDWFITNIVPLENGYDIEKILFYENDSKEPDWTGCVEVYDVNDLDCYFELHYGNTIRFFKNIVYKNSFFHKESLLKYFQPVDELVLQNKPFLFLIEAGLYHNIKKIILSDKILSLIDKKLCKIVLNTSYETFNQNDDEFVIFLNNFSEKYNLTKDNLKILSGNLIANNEENDKYEYIPYPYFLENPWFIDKDAFPYHPNPEKTVQNLIELFNERKITLVQKNKNIKSFDKKILSLNRRARPHRKYLFYYLYNNEKILNNTFLSFWNDPNAQFIDYENDLGISYDESLIINKFYYFNTQDFILDADDLSMNYANKYNSYLQENTFLTIVTETLINLNVVFISEKTFKPIYSCRPFIIFGSPYTIKKLKELGFKTFDKWWDESYDEELTVELRLKKILSVLEYICSKSDEELSVILNEMEEVVVHNYELFTKINNDYFESVSQKMYINN
jgi:hypothetical protein